MYVQHYVCIHYMYNIMYVYIICTTLCMYTLYVQHYVCIRYVYNIMCTNIEHLNECHMSPVTYH